MGTKRWFILLTDIQGENRALRWLTEGQPYGTKSVDNVYLPRLLTLVRVGRWPKRKRGVMRPIIPGYIFVLLDDEEPSTELLKTPGIREFLRNADGKRETCTPEEIQCMRDVEAILNDPKNGQKTWPFAPGNKVEITEGPFLGFRAILKRLDKKGNALLHLDPPGRGMPVHISAQWLKAM